MNEFSDLQKKIMASLIEKGFSREDIFSVMLVLSDENKIEKFKSFIDKNPTASHEKILQTVGEIAF